MASEHSPLRLLLSLSMILLAGLWTGLATGRAFDGKPRSDASSFQHASPQPVTGRFQRVSAPSRSTYPTMGQAGALVTIRLFAPAPNAWKLWRRIGSPGAILNRLSGEARIELLPCAWSPISILNAIQSMVRWHRGRATAEQLAAGTTWRTSPFLRSRRRGILSRVATNIFSPLSILSSSMAPQTKDEFISALKAVLRSTHLLLSMGRSCQIRQPVTILVGGRILSVPERSMNQQLPNLLVAAYQREVTEAKKAIRRGLPRRLLARWQLKRALAAAMASGNRPTGEARRVIELQAAVPNHAVAVQGGIPLSTLPRGRRKRIDLFVALNRTTDMVEVGLMMMMARAFSDEFWLVLHPLETALSPNRISTARLLTAAFLTGILPMCLETMFRSFGVSSTWIGCTKALGANRAKRLLQKARSPGVTAMLAADIRRITALGHLPTDSLLVTDGRLVSFSISDTMQGMLALFTGLQTGLFHRFAGLDSHWLDPSVQSRR